MKNIAQPSIVTNLRAAGIVVLFLAIAGTPIAESRSETVILVRDIAPLQKGVEMEFFIDQKKGFVDTYTMRMVIDAIARNTLHQPTGVAFHWEAFGATKHPKFKTNGAIETTNLLRSRSLNPKWSSGKKVVTQGTFAWLSRDVCEEVFYRGETRLSIDASIAAGRPLRFHRVRAVQYPVRVQGHEAILKGVELRSERGDHLVMLEDCNNPLVLEAQILGLSTWRLDTVRLTQPSSSTTVW